MTQMDSIRFKVDVWWLCHYGYDYGHVLYGGRV